MGVASRGPINQLCRVCGFALPGSGRVITLLRALILVYEPGFAFPNAELQETGISDVSRPPPPVIQH